MKTLLLIFTLAFCAFGQTASESTTEKLPAKTVEDLMKQKKKFKFDERYLIAYDKFEDQTVVRCMGFNMIGFGENLAEAMSNSMGGYGRNSTLSSLFFGTGFSFKGNALENEPADYFLLFYYQGDQWKFLRNSKLIVLLDGETRIQFGEGEAVRDVNSRSVTEIIGFRAAKEQISQMANAKTIEVKIGNYAKPLKKESSEMFANILKLGDLAQRAEEKKKKD